MAVRVVGPLQWIVYPALIAIAATIVLATPAKLFGLTLPEPILPMVLAFSWPLIRPSVMAPVVLLGLGLALDAFWHGPFGMWGLALSAVYGVVLMSRSFLLGQETRVLFVWYTACTLMAFVLAYIVVTIGSPTAPSLLATIAQIVPTLLVFPLAHIMIERFDDGDVRFR